MKLTVNSSLKLAPKHEVEVLARFAHWQVGNNMLPEDKTKPMNLTVSSSRSNLWRAKVNSRGDTFEIDVLVKDDAANFSHSFESDGVKFELRSQRELIVFATALAMEWALARGKGLAKKDRSIRARMAASDVLDAYRRDTFALDEQIEEAKYEEMERAATFALAHEQRNDPVTKAMQAAQKAARTLEAWTRKAKLAATKIRKYKRAVRRAERRVARLKAKQTTTENKGNQ